MGNFGNLIGPKESDLIVQKYQQLNKSLDEAASSRRLKNTKEGHKYVKIEEIDSRQSVSSVNKKDEKSDLKIIVEASKAALTNLNTEKLKIEREQKPISQKPIDQMTSEELGALKDSKHIGVTEKLISIKSISASIARSTNELIQAKKEKNEQLTQKLIRGMGYFFTAITIIGLPATFYLLKKQKEREDEIEKLIKDGKELTDLSEGKKSEAVKKPVPENIITVPKEALKENQESSQQEIGQLDLVNINEAQISNVPVEDKDQEQSVKTEKSGEKKVTFADQISDRDEVDKNIKKLNQLISSLKKKGKFLIKKFPELKFSDSFSWREYITTLKQRSYSLQQNYYKDPKTNSKVKNDIITLQEKDKELDKIIENKLIQETQVLQEGINKVQEKFKSLEDKDKTTQYIETELKSPREAIKNYQASLELLKNNIKKFAQSPNIKEGQLLYMTSKNIKNNIRSQELNLIQMQRLLEAKQNQK